jgi:Fe-S-cluster containining protein
MPQSPQQRDWEIHLQSLADFAKDHSRRALERERSVENSQKLIRKLHLIASEKIEALQQSIDAMPPERRREWQIDCKPGCDYCCHQLVAAAATEVIAIARYILESCSPAEIDDYKSRALTYAAHYKESGGPLTRLPCPLLRNGLCSVYEVRPFPCRGYTSLEVGRCKASFEHPEEKVFVPGISGFSDTSGSIFAGHQQGLHDCKLNPYAVNLGLGLAILLADPTAAERYLGGEDVFESARIEGQRAWPDRAK